MNDEDGGENGANDGEVLHHKRSSVGSIGRYNELGRGIAEGDGNSDEEDSHNYGEAETFFVCFNEFGGIVFAECSADHCGCGDSDGHAEADEEEKGCGGGPDCSEGIFFEMLNEVGIEE